jgi:hypothetical protein
MIDRLTSFLFSAGVPPVPGDHPDLRAQALDLLDSPGRLRASWAEVSHRLEDEGYEAGEFALYCRVHLNLLDNCAALLEVLAGLSDQLGLPADKVRNAVAEVESQQGEVRRLYDLATQKPPPLDAMKLLAASGKHAGEPAVEIGDLVQQVQAGRIGP